MDDVSSDHLWRFKPLAVKIPEDVKKCLCNLPITSWGIKVDTQEHLGKLTSPSSALDTENQARRQQVQRYILWFGLAKG